MNIAALIMMCVAQPAQFDMNGIRSFQVAFSGDRVQLNQVKLSDKALVQIQKSTDPEVKKIYVAGLRGFKMSGTVKPYLNNPPKTPRVRFPLTSNAVSVPVLSDVLAYEGERMTVFVPLVNGKPAYTQLYLEYDGTQGPYYDHFTCSEQLN